MKLLSARLGPYCIQIAPVIKICIELLGELRILFLLGATSAASVLATSVRAIIVTIVPCSSLAVALPASFGSITLSLPVTIL